MRAAVLIPAYKPGPEFPRFVFDLIDRGVSRIVVVDDGSGPAYRARFDELASAPQVRVFRHAINLGKGAALKTGINAVLCEYADASVVVTADADGQHDPADVLAVAQFGEARPDALVLGIRSFAREVPFRSRFGNRATRLVMRLAVGQNLADTQTGLRSIPYHFLPSLLKIAPQGYDFEIDMLVLCKNTHVPILEMPIRTIYLDGNASSHFNPLLDSMRIYFVLLRFAGVALFSAAIDNLLFSAIFLWTSSILYSHVGARIPAMLFNFAVVKRVVFKSRQHVYRQLLQYVVLVAVSGTVSYGMMQVLIAYLGFGVLRAKLLAEAILFFANFLVQRDVIFTDHDERRRAATERELRASATGVVRAS